MKKELHKNTNAVANSIKAYACPCACDAYPCSTNDYGMRTNTTGAITR